MPVLRVRIRVGRGLGSIAAALRARAGTEHGLHVLGITDTRPAATLAAYEEWVERGFHGEMGYLARSDRLARRRNLDVVLPGAQAVVMFALPYLPGRGHFPDASRGDVGIVSSYAWGRDYHDILGGKLKGLARWLEETAGGRTRWYVDTGAVMERDLASRAGLGFIGKNTLLINGRVGSGVFLGEIFTTIPLARAPADSDTRPRRRRRRPPRPPSAQPSKKLDCGPCERCQVACPTQAFVGPRVLDARRCISYLTIELKGSIPVELRPLLGNRIYGCDVCQSVCPFNRRFVDESPLFGSPPEETTAPKLLELIRLDEAGFQERFRGSPIRRIKRARLLRNVAVAIGNSGMPDLFVPELKAILERPDEDPLVVEHVEWALQRLTG